MRRKAAFLSVLVCISLLCGCIDIDSLTHFTGTEADEKLFYSLSEFNYAGMCEAVKSGANVNRLKFSAMGTESPLHWLLTGEGKIGYNLFGNCTNLDFIGYLLKQGADPDYADSKGRTLAMLCCQADGFGYMAADQILRLLLQNGADITLTDSDGMTVLDYSVISGSTADISLLLEYGAVPSEQTLELAFTLTRSDIFHSDRASAAKIILDACPAEIAYNSVFSLLLSAARGDSDAVIAGAADCPESDMEMLAQLAIAFCSLDAVRAVKDAGFAFDSRRDGATSADGWVYAELALQNRRTDTALWLLNELGLPESDALKYSARQGLADMTAFFLERGALRSAMPRSIDGFDLEIFDNLPADCAAYANIMALLFDAGYPANEQSLAQALNQAIISDNLDSVRYLCETAGADAAYLPEGIFSAMETACMHGNLEIVRYLQSQGAGLDTEKGCLAAAVMKHHAEVAGYLLVQGISPNEVSDSGISPLFYAIQDGRYELVKLLIDAGAGLDAESNGGGEPVLHYAARHRSAEILQLLIDSGADVTAVDRNGSNAADIACSEENLRILAQSGCHPSGSE